MLNTDPNNDKNAATDVNYLKSYAYAVSVRRGIRQMGGFLRVLNSMSMHCAYFTAETPRSNNDPDNIPPEGPSGNYPNSPAHGVSICRALWRHESLRLDNSAIMGAEYSIKVTRCA